MKKSACCLAAIAVILTCPPALAAEGLPGGEDGAMFASLQQNIIGVMGSGERMSLQILNGKGIDTVGLGKPYRNGWVLGALDASSARFDQAGKPSVTVMLSPDAAPPAPRDPAAPSTVEVVSSATVLALAQQAIDQHLWDGKPILGMNLAESQRMASYWVRLKAFTDQYGDAAEDMLAGNKAYDYFDRQSVDDYRALQDQQFLASLKANEPLRLTISPRDPDPVQSTRDSIMVAQALQQQYADHPLLAAYFPGYIERLQAFLAQLQAGK